MLRRIIYSIFLLCPVIAFGADNDLAEKIADIISGFDARIGVAVITHENDTISVNGDEVFPMLSVYKFPIALRVAEYCDAQQISFNDTIAVRAGELKENTWSPMRDKYGIRDLRLPLSELMVYSLQQSDNNACDILLRFAGGVEPVDNLMSRMGFPEIRIRHTEAEMHENESLCIENSATPVEMAALFKKFFDEDLNSKSPAMKSVGDMLLSCETGQGRLPLPLADYGWKIAHKTGTGDAMPDGRLLAVNDAGYVFIGENQGYAIAVFVSDAACDFSSAEALIAEISSLVRDYIAASLNY